MSYTIKEVEALLTRALAKVRVEVYEAWAAENFKEARDGLWQQHKAIEKIEEGIRHELRNGIDGREPAEQQHEQLGG